MANARLIAAAPDRDSHAKFPQCVSSLRNVIQGRSWSSRSRQGAAWPTHCATEVVSGPATVTGIPCACGEDCGAPWKDVATRVTTDGTGLVWR